MFTPASGSVCGLAASRRSLVAGRGGMPPPSVQGWRPKAKNGSVIRGEPSAGRCHFGACTRQAVGFGSSAPLLEGGFVDSIRYIKKLVRSGQHVVPKASWFCLKLVQLASRLVAVPAAGPAAARGRPHNQQGDRDWALSVQAAPDPTPRTRRQPERSGGGTWEEEAASRRSHPRAAGRRCCVECYVWG